jgi:hypothetical protein
MDTQGLLGGGSSDQHFASEVHRSRIFEVGGPPSLSSRFGSTPETDRADESAALSSASANRRSPQRSEARISCPLSVIGALIYVASRHELLQRSRAIPMWDRGESRSADARLESASPAVRKLCREQMPFLGRCQRTTRPPGRGVRAMNLRRHHPSVPCLEGQLRLQIMRQRLLSVIRVPVKGAICTWVDQPGRPGST